MPKPPALFNAVLSTLAPAHARRKRVRSTFESPVFIFPSAEKRPPTSPEATQSRLQAAHAARRTDEMRSAF